MKPVPLSRTILLPLLALLVVQFACSVGAQPSDSAPQPPGAGTTAPSASGPGQVVVSGTLNKTFTPVNVSIGRFGPEAIRLYMSEPLPEDLSRVGDLLTLDLPAGIQTGTYAFESFIDNPSINMWATYGTTDGVIAEFRSISGTLTLTAVGATYSGEFQFTAQDSSDASRTIEVSGSFSDLPFNQ